MRSFKALVLGLFLTLASITGAVAQCGTQAPANKFCGNDTGSAALAGWKTIPSGALTPIAGGTVLGNPTAALAVPVPTTAPVLGIPGTSTGQVGLAGLTSGTAILRAQSVAGSAVSLLPTSAGTLVGTATAPLAINATTGLVSITGQAGAVLAGSGPAFTINPVLGIPTVSQGTLGFAGVTSGTATITAQAVAGTPSLALPNTSGTFAVNAATPLVLSLTTGGLTCPTCVTSSGGGAITGTAPITVSAAGVVALTTVPANLGGTGFASYAVGDILFATTTTTFAKLADIATGNAIISGGVGVAPSYGKIGISTHVSGLGTGIAAALAVNVGSAGAPVLFNGALGTPTSGVATNLTGTAAGLTAGTVTTNANLTGPITSTGNATAVASQTGTGSTFVMNTSPTLVTPVLGVATGTSLALGGCTIGANSLCTSGTTLHGDNTTVQKNQNATTSFDITNTDTTNGNSRASMTFTGGNAIGNFIAVNGGSFTIRTLAAVPLTFQYNGTQTFDMDGSVIRQFYPSATAVPVTKTGTSGTVGVLESSIIINASGPYTLTLPAAAGAYSGRWIYIKSIAAQTVTSASSNVVPRSTATAGTAILASGAGNWTTLQSDGANWITMAGTP